MQKEDVFFSYSRTDGDFVLKLAKDLRAQGVLVWLDQLDIEGGMRWDEAIELALENCKTLIVVLSPRSIASNNVMDEVSYALEEGRRVIPIVCEDCKVPFRLRRVQQVDFSASYEQGLKRLSMALKLTDNTPSPADQNSVSNPNEQSLEVASDDVEYPINAQDQPVDQSPPGDVPVQPAQHTPSEHKKSALIPKLFIALAFIALAGGSGYYFSRNIDLTESVKLVKTVTDNGDQKVLDDKAELKRLAAEKLEYLRIADEKVKKQQLADKEQEEKRIADRKAEAQRLIDKKAEEDRIADRKAEAQRLIDKKAEEDRIAYLRKQQLRDAEIERQRLNKLAAKCIQGQWGEISSATWGGAGRWTMRFRGDDLFIARDDGAVKGIVKWYDKGYWQGDLTWYDGNISRLQLQIPSEDCTLARTDQGWQFKRYRSISGSAIELTIKNASNESIQVFWIDPEGSEVLYHKGLAPGASFIQKTYSGHPWRFKNVKSGAEIGTYIPTSSPSQSIAVPL